MNLALTYFPRLRDAKGTRVRTSWAKLVERLQHVRIVADKHEAPGLSLATYRGDRRSLANVEHVFAVGLDLDHLDALPVRMARTPGLVVDAHDWSSLTTLFARVDSFIHTTWSSTDEALRVRVFLPLSRPVTADEYRRVYTAVVGQCERSGLLVDRQASDPSRFWFLPAIPPDGAYRFAVGHGKPVNVEGALAAVPPPEPPAPPPPSRTTSPGLTGNVEARARAYLARCAPAISGSGGHTATFLVARALVQGFALDEATAYALLAEWNLRCEPPWSERELRRKLQQARERGTGTHGALRDRPLRRAS